MAKAGIINHRQETIFKKLDKHFEKKNEKEFKQDIKYFKNKYEVIVKSQNVYTIINEVYKALLKKDKQKHEEVRKYFATGKQLLTIENIFNKVNDFIEFIAEDENGCRWILHRFEDFKELRK